MKTNILKKWLRETITEVLREEIMQSFALKDDGKVLYATPLYNIPETGSVFIYDIKGVKYRFFIVALETEHFNTYTIVTAHGHLIR